MKVSVLGAGAIGSMLGGLIQHHNRQLQVQLIVRGDHGQAVCRRQQLTLLGPWGRYDVPIRASTDVAEIAGSSFVLVAVKSQSTEEAMRAAEPHLGDAIVISLQNGFNDEVLERYAARQRLVMGLTATNVNVVEPGTVSLQFNGAMVVGPHEDLSNREAASEAAQLLRKTGLRVAYEENLLGVRYNKLAINAPGYASCLSRTNFIADGVCYRPWRHQVGMPLVDECLRLFDAAGIQLTRVAGLPDIRKLRRFFRLLDWPLLGGVVALVARRIFRRRPIVFSLEQDLLRGKGTEVDFTCGQLLRLAGDHGQEAPYNDLVVRLAHQLEQRGAGSFLTRQEVIERFNQITAPVAHEA